MTFKVTRPVAVPRWQSFTVYVKVSVPRKPRRGGVLVILGTPDTLIERNRIVAGEGSEVGILLDDAPGTKLRDNRIEDHGVDGFTDVDDDHR